MLSQHLLANHKQELQAFKEFLLPNSECRILLFEAESGMGKTTLLHNLKALARREFTHYQIVSFDLKGNSIGILELFYKLGEELDWDNLKFFSAAIEECVKNSTQFNVNIKGNSFIGFQNKLQVLLQEDGNQQHKFFAFELTKALFKDLKSLQIPLLIFLDTYQQVSKEVQEWIEHHFLSQVAKNAQLRIVIAGQQVPADNIEWGAVCTSYLLKPAMNPQDWLTVFDALKRKTPTQETTPLGFLDTVCRCYPNQPESIKQMIEGLTKCDEAL